MFYQYNELINCVDVEKYRRCGLFRKIAFSFVRILAATPSSSDVKRAISANNLIKTFSRARIDIATENKNLYVHYNMPVLDKWSPRDAIILWLHDKDRRQQQNNATTEITRQQVWFKEIFDNTNESSDETGEYC